MELKIKAVLDPQFAPMSLKVREMRELTKDNGQEIVIGVERNKGAVTTYRTRIFPDGTGHDEENYRFVERIVKSMLWVAGGFKIIIAGSEVVAQRIKEAYVDGGYRDFDLHFMENVYESKFEVVSVALEDAPKDVSTAAPIGRHLDGCRIGFDAGGSDRKVSAVIDGECVYSEEVIWFPKLNEDPDYHYNHILEAFQTAASKMPRVDAIGVSSAGDYIDNEPRVASLFIKVPRDNWDKVKTIYTRAAAAIGDVPLVVANDGDVSALAGAMGLGKGKMMGLAMGTSEAVGYVDAEQNVLGWINELAFAPVDLQTTAMQDEWSLDYGVGCKYFSQDAVIKLCPAAGIELDESLSLAEKLKAVQKLMEADDPRAQAIFETIGAYFGYTVVLYSQFYDLDYIMLMGRVMSGKGGDTILRVTNEILASEYPELAAKCNVTLPDEKMRRVGQAVAAASLPVVKK